MKQGSNQRRSRGRGNSGGNRRNPRNQSYESNGPDVKVRGTAQQVLDKYLQLARDAQSGGDRVKAEAYLQFAEHYYRIVNADQDEQDKRQQDRGNRGNRGNDTPSDAMEQPSVEAQTEDSADDQADAAQEPQDKADKPRGRGRSRGNGTGRAPRKNEATLAAEAAAANEKALKAEKAEAADSDGPTEPEAASA